MDALHWLSPPTGDDDLRLQPPDLGDRDWWQEGSTKPTPPLLAQALTPSPLGGYDAALPSDYRSAGPEILSMMFAGQNNPSVSGWLNQHWDPTAGKGPVSEDNYTMAQVADQLIGQILHTMQQTGFDVNDGAEFAKRVAACKPLETHLRHFAGQQAWNKYKDADLVNKILFAASPGGDVTPSWLMTNARDFSQALY